MTTPHIIGGVRMIIHQGEIYCRLHDIIDQAENDQQIENTFEGQEEEEDNEPAPPPRQRGKLTDGSQSGIPPRPANASGRSVARVPVASAVSPATPRERADVKARPHKSR